MVVDRRHRGGRGCRRGDSLIFPKLWILLCVSIKLGKPVVDPTRFRASRVPRAALILGDSRNFELQRGVQLPQLPRGRGPTEGSAAILSEYLQAGNIIIAARGEPRQFVREAAGCVST